MNQAVEPPNQTPCNCRRCGFDLESDDFEYQERLEINFRAGYASVFGDENIVRTVLCQNCVKDVLGEWLEIVEDNDSHQAAVSRPLGAYQPHQVRETDVRQIDIDFDADKS
jgi:hypothetical protein